MANSLLDKASIITTPTAYSDGSLHSVKPVNVFGSELVTNGTFDTDSNWNKTNATISNGIATITVTSGSYSAIDQSVTYVSGKKYRITAQIQGLSGSSGRQVRFQDNGSNTGGLTLSNGVITLDETLQNIDITWTANSNSNGIVIARNTTGSFNYAFTVDNVSIKEDTSADFDFTRGSSATRVNENGLIEDVQILSGNLVQNGDFSQIGSELITNGTFDNNINGWSQYVSTSTWDNGTIKTTSTSNLAYIRQNNVFTQNKQYKVTFKAKATNITHSLKIYNGSSFIDTGLSFDVADTYKEFTYYLNFVGASIHLIIGQSNINNGDSINFDNISVKEVGQNWTLTNGATIEDGQLVLSASANLYQSIPLTVGKKYRVKYEITSIDAGSSGITVFGGSTSGTTREEVGTYTEDIIQSGSGLLFFFTGGGFNSGTIDNVSVKEVTDDTDLPRIDYTSGTGSLLLEPQSTNLITYSEDFTNSYWRKDKMTVTPNSIISPTGELNASLIQETSFTSSIPSIDINSPSSLGAGTYTFSFYVKNNNGRYLGISFGSSAERVRTNFDFNTNTFKALNLSGSTTGIASFTTLGNFYRISITATFPSATVADAVLTPLATDTYPFFAFQNSDNRSFYLWGVQVENLSYATSYIPTNGSTVTRLADVCNNAGSSDLINSTEGVLYAEIAALASGTGYRVISISDGSTSNVVRFYYSPTPNRIGVNLRSNSADVFSIANLNITNDLEYIKIAISYKLNDFKIYINGTQVQSYTSGSVPIGLNELAFDNGAGNDKFNGNVKSVAVFKEALSNDELECLTGEGFSSFNALAQANNYTII